MTTTHTGAAAPDSAPPLNRMHVWACKIGGERPLRLPPGADDPMRTAVERAFREIAGRDPLFVFSGWGGALTEGELAVVEGRDPEPPAEAALLEDMDGAPFPEEVQIAHRLALADALAEAASRNGTRGEEAP